MYVHTCMYVHTLCTLLSLSTAVQKQIMVSSLSGGINGNLKSYDTHIQGGLMRLWKKQPKM
jgi:hypothetical protein